MNRKGFTLVELLAVIVLIAVITLITVPSIKYASKRIQQKNYETKVKIIKAAAEEYGDDYKEIINYSSTETYTNPQDGQTYPSKTINVLDLLFNGYLTYDAGESSQVFLDPRDKSDMSYKSITIYIKNNNPYVVLNF